jgi:ferredoxin
MARRIMKVAVDARLCSGHGRCEAIAPDVFHLDDVGYNVARGQVVDIPPELEAQARLGVESCPERALVIEDEDVDALSP